MTWITDEQGTRWVEPMERKRRRPARAIRFAEIKIGDQLMRRWKTHDGASDVWYYLVTDLWFDPVAGQDDETAGRMVAIRTIDPRTGEWRTRKQAHTVRGLASQGFHYAQLDFIAHAKTVTAAKAEGAVVSIGLGKLIRERPKTPGRRL